MTVADAARERLIKLFSLAVVVVLIINIILLAAGKASVLFFWSVIAVSALLAYVALPKLKK